MAELITVPSGTSSIGMRTEMRCASQTQANVGVALASNAGPLGLRHGASRASRGEPIGPRRHARLILEGGAEMRRAVETPGKADVGARTLRLGRIAQLRRALADATCPDISRDRPGGVGVEGAMNAAR